MLVITLLLTMFAYVLMKVVIGDVAYFWSLTSDPLPSYLEDYRDLPSVPATTRSIPSVPTTKSVPGTEPCVSPKNTSDKNVNHEHHDETTYTKGSGESTDKYTYDEDRYSETSVLSWSSIGHEQGLSLSSRLARLQTLLS
jgi:hypothetical protein